MLRPRTYLVLAAAALVAGCSTPAQPLTASGQLVQDYCASALPEHDVSVLDYRVIGSLGVHTADDTRTVEVFRVRATFDDGTGGSIAGEIHAWLTVEDGVPVRDGDVPQMFNPQAPESVVDGCYLGTAEVEKLRPAQ